MTCATVQQPTKATDGHSLDLQFMKSGTGLTARCTCGAYFGRAFKCNRGGLAFAEANAKAEFDLHLRDIEREKRLERQRDLWWEENGQLFDPDTADVPWFDKREALAKVAFMAGAGHLYHLSIQRDRERRDLDIHRIAIEALEAKQDLLDALKAVRDEMGKGRWAKADAAIKKWDDARAHPERVSGGVSNYGKRPVTKAGKQPKRKI